MQNDHCTADTPSTNVLGSSASSVGIWRSRAPASTVIAAAR
ncbi:hypothetical protein [Streptomyces sp. MnatMP-M27]|nr:hypothetical protein [Streptomyces sp. MnatMP-M27]